MIKGITKKEHVFADYSYVPAAFLAPKLMHFEDNDIAAKLSRGIAVTSLAISLLTDAKWGLFKVIPYKVHAMLDVSTGVLALAAAATPPMCKDRNARNTFLVMGITALVVGALSVVGAKYSEPQTQPFS